MLRHSRHTGLPRQKKFDVILLSLSAIFFVNVLLSCSPGSECKRCIPVLTMIITISLQYTTNCMYVIFQGKTERIQFPAWGDAMVIIFVCLALMWIPLIAILRYFGLCAYQGKTMDPHFQKTTSKLELTNGYDEKPPLDTANGDFDSKL